MSYMMESLHQDPSAMAGGAHFAAPSSAPTFRLKRPGARPLVFEGSELAMAMSFTPGLPYWYEVNLYRTTDQRFVTAVKLYYQSADEQDTARAWEFDSLDQALEKLAHYDAGQDVKLSLDPGNAEMGAAELAACAMELRARVMGARRHYESLIGEFFFDLEQPKR